MVSLNTVKNWEKAGKLHPRKRPGTRAEHGHAVNVYDPHEVAALPRATRIRAKLDNPGEVVARAFDLFSQGESKRVVVMRLRKTPEEVERFYEDWLSLGGADLVVNDNARAEIGRYVGAFASIEELIERVREKLGVAIEATVPDELSDGEIEDVLRESIQESDNHNGG